MSAASQRAEAGDATATRRLAWREAVMAARGRGKHAVERLTETHRQAAYILRAGPLCAACDKRLAQARENVEYWSQPLQALVGTVPTYAEDRQRVTAANTDAEAWLRRQLDGLWKEGA